ncbi:MAG: sugar phosphate isomerase/epimerase [Lachnospiraceae bacterium]|nr:sugar phosphate isomerase/epimerase [Lachnospiraceae bacterium]
MREAIHSYFRLGTVFFVSYPGAAGSDEELLERLRQFAADDAFEAIELTHIENPAVRKEVIEIVKSACLDVSYAAQGCLLGQKKNLNALDEGERRSAVELMKSCIDEACEMGAESVSFLAGKYEPGKEADAMDALVASVCELCDYMESKGKLRLAIEVFDYDLDKCSLIGPAYRVKELMERVCPLKKNFGALVDLSHIPQIHESVKEAILPVRDYIIQAHMGNCVIKEGCSLRGDLHPRYGYPNSEVDLPMIKEYLETLLEIGFLSKEKRPILSFEVKPFGTDDPKIIMAASKRMLTKAWDLACPQEEYA